jgi:hypothetical protein
MPRLHAWLEPLGIGGHVLATGVARSSGCFRCLFQTDTEYGLTNAASFVEPGQAFQRTYADRAGTFTLFTALMQTAQPLKRPPLLYGSSCTRRPTMSW